MAPHEVEDYREWGYASSLTMPLVAGGSIVGLVDIYDDAERDWSVELEFLTGVMQLVAGVFDNAALMSEVQERSTAAARARAARRAARGRRLAGCAGGRGGAARCAT